MSRDALLSERKSPRCYTRKDARAAPVRLARFLHRSQPNRSLDMHKVGSDRPLPKKLRSNTVAVRNRPPRSWTSHRKGVIQHKNDACAAIVCRSDWTYLVLLHGNKDCPNDGDTIRSDPNPIRVYFGARMSLCIPLGSNTRSVATRN